MVLAQNFSQQWSTIRELMTDGKFATAIKESGPFLESIVKTLILEYTSKMPREQRNAFSALEGELAEGPKGIESFELGRLVQILVSKEIKFIEFASKTLEKDEQILKSINFGYLQKLRNIYSHSPSPASHSEAQYFVSSLEIILSFFNIDVVDLSTLLNDIEELRKENRSLKDEKGSIEEINGFVPFYERYAELEATMNYRDSCYYAERDPFSLNLPDIKQLYEKVHYSASTIRKVRVIVNLFNHGPIPWLLFYRFVRDWERMERGDVEYRGFSCHSGHDSFVSLMHTVLLYNVKEMDNGYVILSRFDSVQERKQKNVIIQNKRLFGFLSSAYADMFNSCEVINMAKIKGMYTELYGPPTTVDDLEQRIQSYFAMVPDAQADADAAIKLWRGLFDF